MCAPCLCARTCLAGYESWFGVLPPSGVLIYATGFSCDGGAHITLCMGCSGTVVVRSPRRHSHRRTASGSRTHAGQGALLFLQVCDAAVDRARAQISPSSTPAPGEALTSCDNFPRENARAHTHTMFIRTFHMCINTYGRTLLDVRKLAMATCVCVRVRVAVCGNRKLDTQQKLPLYFSAIHASFKHVTSALPALLRD